MTELNKMTHRMNQVISLRSDFQTSTRWLYKVGAAGLILAAVLLFPGNPLWDLSRTRVPNTILVYVSLICLMVGIYQDRDRFSAWFATRPLWVQFAWALGLPLGWVVLLRLMSDVVPDYLSSISREWGLIEPLTFGAYWMSLSVTLSWVRIRRDQGLEYKPYQALAVLFGIGVLEECDYLGIFGGIIGRIEGVYVGALHDLVTLWHRTGQPLGWAIVGIGFGVAMTVWLWKRGYCSWTFLGREIWTVFSLPILLGTVLMGLAQLADVDSRLLGPLTLIWCGACEETFEFLGAVLVLISVLLRMARDYGGDEIASANVA